MTDAEIIQDAIDNLVRIRDGVFDFLYGNLKPPPESMNKPLTMQVAVDWDLRLRIDGDNVSQHLRWPSTGLYVDSVAYTRRYNGPTVDIHNPAVLIRREKLIQDAIDAGLQSVQLFRILLVHEWVHACFMDLGGSVIDTADPQQRYKMQWVNNDLAKVHEFLAMWVVEQIGARLAPCTDNEVQAYFDFVRGRLNLDTGDTYRPFFEKLNLRQLPPDTLWSALPEEFPELATHPFFSPRVEPSYLSRNNC